MELAKERLQGQKERGPLEKIHPASSKVQTPVCVGKRACRQCRKRTLRSTSRGGSRIRTASGGSGLRGRDVQGSILKRLICLNLENLQCYTSFGLVALMRV